MSVAVALGWLGLLGWVYLALLRGQFWRPYLTPPASDPDTWPSVDIIVPARDEAAALPQSLPSLLKQNYRGAWRIVLIDDHSQDGTGALAQKLATAAPERLTMIKAPDLAPGWSGKVAAMNAGVAESHADYILFTDADIEHPADSLRDLVASAESRGLDLVSRMVKLHCETFAEKLLIPAYIFFFTLLYPFTLSNDAQSEIAAAAGGVMLVRRQALNNIGGLVRIKSALIDDCALAKAIKNNGGGRETPGHTEIAMSRSIKSLRVYERLGETQGMITRTAFTQLKCSPLNLAVTIAGMTILFLLPVLMTAVGGLSATKLALANWLIMSLLYIPTISFYRLPFVWAFTLPMAAAIYMLATVDSARLYWQGKGGQWKGRSQA